MLQSNGDLLTGIELQLRGPAGPEVVVFGRGPAPGLDVDEGRLCEQPLAGDAQTERAHVLTHRQLRLAELHTGPLQLESARTSGG